MTVTIYRGAETGYNRLQELVHSQGSDVAVACFDVTNGSHKTVQRRKATHVRSAKSHIDNLLPSEGIPLIGGLAFIQNPHIQQDLFGIDVIVKVDEYQDLRFTHAVENALEYPLYLDEVNGHATVLDEDQIILVEQLKDLSSAEDIPLSRFFRPDRGTIWPKVRDNVDFRYMDQFVSALKYPSGLIMEMYIADTFREYLDEGHIVVRHRFDVPRTNNRLDIDVCVIAPYITINRMLYQMELHEEGIEVPMRDLPRRKSKKDRKRKSMPSL